MPADASLVGRVYPATDVYRVSREKIREFADAVNDPNPAYRSPEAARALGHPDVVAPPTFPIVFTMAAAAQVYLDPDAGIDFARVVHGEQRFVAHRPLVAGDEIRTTATVEAVRTVGGNEMITVRGDAETVGGEPVVTATMLIVVRGEGS